MAITEFHTFVRNSGESRDKEHISSVPFGAEIICLPEFHGFRHANISVILRLGYYQCCLG